MVRASTVIAVYNGEKFIESAINSVLEQDIVDHELIVVDDGSTDRTSDIVRDIFSKKNCIECRLVSFVENCGRCAARNHGIEIAKSEWIQILDCDDHYAPEKLNVQLEIAESAPANVAAVYSPYRSYCSDENGEIILDSIIFPNIEDANPAKFVLHSGAVHHSCMLIRRSVLLTIGGYRADFEPWEDEEIKFRMVRNGYHFRRTAYSAPVLFFRMFTEKPRWGGHEARYDIGKVASALVGYLSAVKTETATQFSELSDQDRSELQWLMRTVGRGLARVHPDRFGRFVRDANAVVPSSIKWHHELRWRLAGLRLPTGS